MTRWNTYFIMNGRLGFTTATECCHFFSEEDENCFGLVAGIVVSTGRLKTQTWEHPVFCIGMLSDRDSEKTKSAGSGACHNSDTSFI
jgi:hypothetical protein